MSKKMNYDPWQNVKTRNGFDADLVISALQKSIRRANEEDACKFAYELYITSPEMEAKMWRRLLTISVEDIGMGNPLAPVIVHHLCEMKDYFAYADGDRPIYFIHAIRYMVQSQKDRSSDLLKNLCIKGFAMGELPVIPDVAYDKHTRKGQEMGRDSFHFLNEASIVIPQMEIDNDYKERYLKLLEKYDPENISDTTFKYNSWQY